MGVRKKKLRALLSLAYKLYYCTYSLCSFSNSPVLYCQQLLFSSTFIPFQLKTQCFLYGLSVSPSSSIPPSLSPLGSLGFDAFSFFRVCYLAVVKKKIYPLYKRTRWAQTVAVKCSITKNKGGIFFFQPQTVNSFHFIRLILFPLLPGACVWFWPDVMEVQHN